MASHGRRFASASVKRHKAMKARKRLENKQLRKQVKKIQQQQRVTKIKYQRLQHSVYRDSPAARALDTKTAFMSKRELLKSGYNREKVQTQLRTYNNRVSSTRQGVKDIWDKSANTIINTRQGRNFLNKKGLSEKEFFNKFHQIQKDKDQAKSFWELYGKLQDVMQVKGVKATSPQIAKEAILHYGNGETQLVSEDIVNDLIGNVYGINL